MPQNFYTECARRLPGKLFSKKKKKNGGSCVPYIANLYERHCSSMVCQPIFSVNRLATAITGTRQ